MSKNIAIIPARSGSKGLKDKNIKILSGKPLLVYSIESARESGIFDEIYVSTDSEEYANIARRAGACVPFLRLATLASDTSGTWDVVREAVRQYEERHKYFDNIALLQPTSPLRTATDIVQAFELFRKTNANSVVSVCEVEHSPLWCNVLPMDLSLNNFISQETQLKPRQNIPQYYRVNGAIYLVKKEFILHEDNLYQKGCYAYLMAQNRSVDIDTTLDFALAEILIKA